MMIVPDDGAMAVFDGDAKFKLDGSGLPEPAARRGAIGKTEIAEAITTAIARRRSFNDASFISSLQSRSLKDTVIPTEIIYK